MTRHLNEETGNQYFRARMKAARDVDYGFADRDFAAHEVGMSKNTLMYIEHGKRKATEGDVEMMAWAYLAPDLALDYYEKKAEKWRRLKEELNNGAARDHGRIFPPR